MKLDADWTKRELTLRLGPIELASAVIEQWIRDGKPACDKEIIQAWYGIVSAYNKNKSDTYSVGSNLMEE